MKKTNIDWPKEFDEFLKSGLSQPQYCKKKGLKYTTFRYHWERRSKNSEKSDLIEIPQTSTNAHSLIESEFLTLKIDTSGKASLQVNIQFSLGRWS
ncbi:IS66 family insertion sequence element accessory protein TnpA [Leptospira santarosai]|uniref:Transposase n=1 Tax=Leptospira santarosai str. MOR084 TaxID=1049984 RepID=A0A0E2BF23_9LEPT|nr:hypothetical protein [Leptospira santarosai]EKO33526.1 hypothetical protein LEP1GSC179_1918 [Leptospira santarosai str. MOR084]EKR93506.1 hypothetical protein LEP1GSC163_1918 [Leptospira santarosai str. CBC379]KXZ24306.1 hypothetical protein AYB33_11110 [Leptospira santarosai]MDI7158443.1 hypothetical protein [Leptospira santarosai]MDI7235524.1 hypothetical protein [Leptospira santarosai]